MRLITATPHRGKFGLLWLGMAALILVAWGTIFPHRTSMAWGPLTGFYGEELYGAHRFRWLDTPAEIAIWSPHTQEVRVNGEWRPGFHASETVLELIVNGKSLGKVPLTQTNQLVDWPVITLKSGQNILRFVSSAGHARISAQDARVVALGVQDLQVHHREIFFRVEYLRFFLGAFLLVLIARRVATILQLSHVDALGAGILGSFAAICVSATVLSEFHGLTGTSWIIGLMVIVTVLYWVRNAPSVRSNVAAFSRRHLILLLLPALLMGCIQLLSPVTKYDDLMYHGSRAGYWLGNHSVFPFLTHNERQEVFPYPGDLLFAFGVFTAHNEMLGRMLVFLSYPATLLLTGGLLIKRGVTQSIAIGTAWLVGTAPQIRDAAIGIKPDLWGLVFTVVAVNAAWNIWRDPLAPGRKINGVILFGAICAAIAVKTSFLLLTPLALVPLLSARSAMERVQLAATGILWLISFGLVLTLAHNHKYEGGWLGSPGMIRVHRPDPGVGAVERHLSRLPFLVIGLPWIPNEALRQQIEKKLTLLAVESGATKPLPLESNQGWPGNFTPTAPEFNHGYSLLWLFALLGTVGALANFKSLASDRDGLAALLIAMLGATMMVGVAVAVRWQSNSDIPERFLVPGFTIVMLGTAFCWHRTGWQNPVLRGSLLGLLAFHAIPFLHDTALFLLQMRNEGMATARADSVLSPAAAMIPPKSKVLLFASQSSGDYVLFHPEYGFPTQIFPWGRRPFSEKAFASALASDNPDFIVFEGPDYVSFHWHDPLNLAPFLNYLDHSPLYSRQTGGTPNLIYRRHDYVP